MRAANSSVPASSIEIDSYRAVQIGQQYLSDEVRPEHEPSRLLSRGVPGYLIAGEVFLQAASKAENPSAEALLQRSIGFFKGASSEITGQLTAETPFQSKALLRLSQLPILRPIVTLDRLPTTEEAMIAYAKTVEVGERLVDIFHRPIVRDNTYDARKKVSGILAEIAVLLLAQRFAINEKLTDCWFPMQSFLEGDHAGTVGKKTNKSWDIDILTALDDKPVSSYRIQVKANHTSMKHGMKYSKRVTRITVDNDLQLPETKEKGIHTKIIKECLVELKNQSCAQARVSSNLDKRSDLLLEKTD